MIAYRAALTLLAALVALGLLWRFLSGREGLADIAERLGAGRLGAERPGAERPPHAGTGAARLWLHGASNGELTAARPLVEHLLRRNPSLTVLITCNTLTARTMARGWGLPRLEARLAPLDYRFCVARFLDREAPTALAVIENELWPNRLLLARRRALPLALVGARVSERSAARWRRLPGIVRPMLEGAALAVPQDSVSGARLVALGLPQAALAPPAALKAAVALEPPAPGALADLGFDRGETVLAASTHEGEEAQVLAAFAAARQARPALRLILAPRHPARGPRVAALIAQSGLSHAVRSAGAAPGDAAVYLADTLGEMPLWYASAGICFVGGSLVPKGGHTPYEPAQFACALLTGPHVENAADAFARLADTGAVRIVEDANALGRALAGLTPPEQEALGKRAADTLGAGDVAPLAERLTQALRLSPAAPHPA